jgi:hypothetical protein
MIVFGHLGLASRGERNARDQPRRSQPERPHALERTLVAAPIGIEASPALCAPRGKGADVLAAVGTAIRICHALIQAERPGAVPPRQCRRACLTVLA